MQKLPVILTGVILIGVIAVGGVIAGDAEDTLCIPMGTLLIEPPDGVEAKRSPVDFPHSIHFDYTCKTCHHTWDGENPILSCTTSGCHDLTSVRSDDGKLEPDLLVRNFKNAFHKNCIDCHMEINRKNHELEETYSLKKSLQKSGPTSCNSCHPRE
jgi:hypothetical protein